MHTSFFFFLGGGGGAEIRCIMENVEVAYRAFSPTWPASMQDYWNERKRWHNFVGLRKEFNSHRTGLGHPIWPPFHCFGTPIWPP